MLYHRAKPILFIILVAALVLGLAMPAFAGGGDDEAKTPQRKIVVFKSSVASDAEREEIERNTGSVKIKDLPLINGAVVVAGSAAEKALRQHSRILRVEDDAIAYTQAETLPWGVNRIDGEKVWPTGNNGSGIKVAVLDTGISLKHPDLKGNIKGGTNTIYPWKSPNDDNGHGSHVAGIIAAVDNDTGVIGVAPGASLFAVKVLNAAGWGYMSDIIEGVQWSVANGMQVINMSFGSSVDTQSFHDALTAAYNAGIVLVAAAGNSGPGDNTVGYPAKYPEVIAVSATSSTDALASFSSRGPEVELAAPGVSILSTYKGSDYKTLSGTSMASPHVAGTAALVLKSLGATAPGPAVRDQVRSKLQETADDMGPTGKDNYYGYGLVDAQEAATGIQTLP